MGHNRSATIGPPMKATPHVTGIAVILLLGSLTVLVAIAAEVVSAIDILRRGAASHLTLECAR